MSEGILWQPMAGETHEQRRARSGKAGDGPVAAATAILLRQGTSGIETLMLRRNASLTFAGGMWVFPGGRVDEIDRADLALGDELGAARKAAVREVREEAGLVISAQVLIPFSHWTPPAITPRQFLTWFFIGEAPAGEVAIDRGEIHDHAWMQPADALQRRNAGEIQLAPPTWVTLYELTAWAHTGEALAAAAGRTPERFVTRVALTPEGPIALWHGDAGHADGDATKPGPRHRLWMHDAGWRYERTV